MSRLVLLALSLAACGAPDPPCSPGALQACRCPDGRTSVAECASSGTWSTCLCGARECDPGATRACDGGVQTCIAGAWSSCAR